MVLAAVLGSLSGPAQQSVSAPANKARRLPPINSTPKRDAAGPANAAAKAAINAGLEKQFAAFRKSAPILMFHGQTEAKNIPEIQVLERQKTFVESLRSQSITSQTKLVAPANSSAPARSATATKPVLGAAAEPSGNHALTSSPTPPPTGSSRPGAVLSSNARICRTAQIYSVNNATSGVVFTQDPAYNDYIIQGCGFGNQGGRVYLSGAVTNGRISMVVKQWGPEQIEAVVLPGLAGVLDGWPDLVVEPAGNPPAKFPNCRFYAQRQSVPLSTIPQNAARLANSKAAEIEYCPAGNNLNGCMFRYSGGPLSNVANGVDRDSGLSGSSFDPGEDVYDFSQLAPGFILEGAGPSWYADSEAICKLWAEGARVGDSFDYSTQGHYGASLKGKNQVVVDWGVDQCAWRWLGIFSVSNFYGAGYSLTVYVKGPIGVDPWTGKPKL